MLTHPQTGKYLGGEERHVEPAWKMLVLQSAGRDTYHVAASASAARASRNCAAAAGPHAAVKLANPRSAAVTTAIGDSASGTQAVSARSVGYTVMAT